MPRRDSSEIEQREIPGSFSEKKNKCKKCFKTQENQLKNIPLFEFINLVRFILKYDENRIQQY